MLNAHVICMPLFPDNIGESDKDDKYLWNMVRKHTAIAERSNFPQGYD